MKRILAALDHSAAAERVYEQALTLATATQAEMMLLHVLSNEDSDSPEIPVHSAFDHYPLLLEQSVWDAYNKRWHRYEQSSLEVLQQLVAQATQAGVSAKLTQMTGTPEDLICNLARTWQADVIVIGSRGRRGLRELLLGSISNYVTHHAPCSVWVVRSQPPAQTESTQAKLTQAEPYEKPNPRSVSQSAFG
ncbi:MAG: universal stress protein [Cyanobacteria bacterium P01_A01_bin.114]